MSNIHSELLRNYQEAESRLQSHFAEIRTNIRLFTGFHYKNNNRFGFTRHAGGDSNQKIRATKNHTQRIVKKIASSIIDASPGTGIYPANKGEQADVKSAELYSSVWEEIKRQNTYRALVRSIVLDFVTCGEVCTCTAFDPTKGNILGYDYEVDDDGKPFGEGVPIFKGKVDIKRIPAYNVLTDHSADRFENTRWNIIRHLLPTKELKAQYANQPDKLPYIDESSSDYQVFDGLIGAFSNVKDYTQVNQIFYRPCSQYPTGYYYYYTNSGILEEGELGISDESGIRYPIQYAGFDEMNTSCRAYSIIKHTKPYQLEINRVASAAIKESITLGYTTILSQAGSKIAYNSIGNGMRHATYTGSKPDIIEGRNGQQYVEYMNQQIDEMYLIANVREHEKEVINPNNSSDAFSGLFKSIRDKKKFSLYAEKIEDLLIEITQTALGAAKNYFTDEVVIPIIGREEQVNIEEFRTSSSLKHVIKIEPRSEDYDTLMGRTLMISQLLQYAGKTLSKEQIGVLAKNLPFLNEEMILEDITSNYDVATNIVLALDRNKFPAFSEYMNHTYIIERLSARMVKSDFEFLSDEVKKKYAMRRKQHQDILVKQQQEAQKATAGYIPSGGGLVGVDFYLNDGGDRQKRARIPFEAIDWLIQKLKQQGSDISQIDGLSMGDKAEIGNAMGAAMPNQQEQGQPNNNVAPFYG
jgi:hypothetical protein